MRHNHTKCPGAKTFEPAEEQVFRTSDVVFFMVGLSSLLPSKGLRVC